MSNDRTLPVTPAERAAAPMLRAWQAWKPDMTDRGPVHNMLVMFGTAAATADLVDAETDDLTPAGAALLARVEADRIAEDIARELVIKLQTGGAPGYVVCDAQVLLTSCIRLAALARLAGTTPIDAPPAKEPR